MLSYVCSPMCALLCVLSNVLSYVCSHLCALTCVLSYVLSSVCSPMCTSVCSHNAVYLSQFHPQHCLGSLAGMIFFSVAHVVDLHPTSLISDIRTIRNSSASPQFV